MIRIDVAPGREVMATIQAEVSDRGIRNAAILLIGAVDLATISTMSATDAAIDHERSYLEPLELSGTGEVVDGEVHVHVTLGRQGDVAVFGHLHCAMVQNFFVHAYVTPVVPAVAAPAWQLDPASGSRA